MGSTKPPGKPETTIARIARVRRMTEAEMRAEYERVFGDTPPASADVDEMFKRIAHQVQTDGGSAPDRPETGGGRQRKVVKKGHPVRGRVLLPGMQLVREYEGKRVSVRVVGRREFEFDGKLYRSLSKIANEITGSHVSGPRWFHLVTPKRKK